MFHSDTRCLSYKKKKDVAVSLPSPHTSLRALSLFLLTVLPIMSIHDADQTCDGTLTSPKGSVDGSSSHGPVLEAKDVESGPSSSPNTEKPIALPTPAAAPIPNGGLTAWLQVVGAFFLFVNSWGIVNTFGVYQTYYETSMLANQTPSAISWIGSLQAFLLLLVGVLTGPLFDLGYFYILNVLGSFLVVFGMMMTSISDKYYQIILAQGVCVGLGCGCLFVPSVAIVGTYFSTKRSLAMGVATSGSSLGAVIYPIVFRRLEPTVGFGWATRVIGFIALATLLISVATMRTRLPPKQRGRSIFELQAFKEAPFSLFTLGEFLGFMGLYIPYYYISVYATRVIGTNENLAFYLLPIINAGSIPGRIIPNFLADKTGPLNILVPFSAVSAILAFAWIGIKDTAGIVVFAVLYGFFSGAFVSLPPATIASLTPNMEQLGARMGTSFVFAGLGVLVGNPIAGAIVDIEKPDFLPPQIFCGVLVAVTTLAMIAARLSSSGLKLKHKI